MGRGAPPNVSLPWDLRKALSATPRGQTCFPAKLLEGQVQREVLPEDGAGVPPCLMVEVCGH